MQTTTLNVRSISLVISSYLWKKIRVGDKCLELIEIVLRWWMEARFPAGADQEAISCISITYFCKIKALILKLWQIEVTIYRRFLTNGVKWVSRNCHKTSACESPVSGGWKYKTFCNKSAFWCCCCQKRLLYFLFKRAKFTWSELVTWPRISCVNSYAW